MAHDHGRKVENIFLAGLKYENFDVTSACFPPFLDVLEDFQSVKIYDYHSNKIKSQKLARIFILMMSHVRKRSITFATK